MKESTTRRRDDMPKRRALSSEKVDGPSFLLCLKSVPDLCLSINNGDFNSDNLLVLKSRSSSKSQELLRRMRWTRSDAGRLWLSKEDGGGKACLFAQASDLPNFFPATVFECPDSLSNPQFQWKLTDQGELVTENAYANAKKNAEYCLTVRECSTKTEGACDPTRGMVEHSLSAASEGFVFRLNPCAAAANKPENSPAQLLAKVEDCALDCPSWALGDKKCDDACNVESCSFDQGDCKDVPPDNDDHHEDETPNKNPINLEMGASDVVGLTVVLLLFVCCSVGLWRRLKRKRLDRRIANSIGMADPDGMELFGTGIRLGNSAVVAAADPVDPSHRNAYDPFGTGDSRFATQNAVAMNQLRYHTRSAGGESFAGRSVSPTTVTRNATTNDEPRVTKHFVEVKLV